MDGAQDVGAVRAFSMADQELFARLSGDRNPIHLDPVAARRTQAGAAVVHGVHGLLWTLELAARRRPLSGLSGIAARFNRFIHLDTPTEARFAERGAGYAGELHAEGQAATTVKLDWGAPAEPTLGEVLPKGEPQILGLTPDAPAFDDMAGLGGVCGFSDPELAAQMFPALTEALGVDAVCAIAAATGVVGMRCPGLHSLFSQLTLRRVHDSGHPGLRWRTRRIDARARWVVIDFAGAGWEGEVICMARREPVEPPTMQALAELVAPDEFAGRTALVIGGSRGLGAVTAKLLAAGGGKVMVTYARGKAEAETLADEIRGAKGAASCRSLACDVTGDVAAQLAGLEGVTHLYYFATPHIARQGAGVYDQRAMADFLKVYVDGFVAVWEALAGQGPLTVLYPSTVFLDERPKGMTEYVMAKAAAEQLCRDLARKAPGVAITTPRLPRVLTDQTAVLPALPTASALEVMLPLLRAEG